MTYMHTAKLYQYSQPELMPDLQRLATDLAAIHEAKVISSDNEQDAKIRAVIEFNTGWRLIINREKGDKVKLIAAPLTADAQWLGADRTEWPSIGLSAARELAAINGAFVSRLLPKVREVRDAYAAKLATYKRATSAAQSAAQAMQAKFPTLRLDEPRTDRPQTEIRFSLNGSNGAVRGTINGQGQVSFDNLTARTSLAELIFAALV